MTAAISRPSDGAPAIAALARRRRRTLHIPPGARNKIMAVKKSAPEAVAALPEMMNPETFMKAFQGKDFVEQVAAPFARFQEQSRDMTEKGLAQFKAQYEQVRKSAETATAALEQTFAVAGKGTEELNARALEALKANMNASFDLWSALLGVKSVSAAIELQTAHARKQFETVTAQSKDMAELAQKVANDSAAPLKAVAGSFKFAS
jgi:phasin